MYKTSQQNGSAILTALFIVALVVILATAMVTRFHNIVRNTQYLQAQAKLYHQNQAAIEWAVLKLKTAVQQDGTVKDTLPLSWQATLPEGLQIQANLVDAQDKFNLNSLASYEYFQPFVRLLSLTNPDLNQDDQTKIAIEIFIRLHLNGGLAAYFWRKQDLLSVKGMTKKIYQNIEPYITSLPDTTPINLNFASDKVIECLDPQLTSAIAERIINERKLKTNGFDNMSDIETIIKASGANLNPGFEHVVTVNSTYFTLTTQIKGNQTFLVTEDVLYRALKQNKAAVVIVKQTMHS